MFRMSGASKQGAAFRLDQPLTTVDYHTGGEPFRIVTGGVPVAQGATVLDRRTWAQEHLDEVRAFLVNEPRGHADMYGGFITPADDEHGNFGVLFFHKDGFSTACGHGTIALATWAVESGLVQPKPGVSTLSLVIDVPSGRLNVEVFLGDQADEAAPIVEAVRFWNVGSFISGDPLIIDTSLGSVTGQISFGGAFYLSVDLGELDGLDLTSNATTKFIALGREIKASLVGHPDLSHPVDDRLSGLYGVIFHEEHDVSMEAPVERSGQSLDAIGRGEIVVDQRNVTIFADGQVDRSPCGSGTSARLAVLHHQGRIQPGQRFSNRGIVATRFVGGVDEVVGRGGRDELLTWVGGRAHRTGNCAFHLDPHDSLGLGFQLR